MTSTVTLEALNRMPSSDFVAELGEVFEHAPWVAEGALAGRPYPTVSALHDAMVGIVRNAAADRRHAFIAGHPELGSRVARRELTDHSQAEQGGLGLDRLSAEEFDRLVVASQELHSIPIFIDDTSGATAARIAAAVTGRSCSCADQRRRSGAIASTIDVRSAAVVVTRRRSVLARTGAPLSGRSRSFMWRG